jgi:hypothetical protein
MFKTIIFILITIALFTSCSVTQKNGVTDNNIYSTVDLFHLPIYREDSSRKMASFILLLNRIKDSVVGIKVFHHQKTLKKPVFSYHYFEFENYPAFFSDKYILLDCVSKDTILIEQRRTIYVSHNCDNVNSNLSFDMIGNDSVKVTRFYFENQLNSDLARRKDWDKNCKATRTFLLLRKDKRFSYDCLNQTDKNGYCDAIWYSNFLSEIPNSYFWHLINLIHYSRY